MDEELAKVGLLNDPRVEYFDAICPSDAGRFTSPGARGCYESHLAILQGACLAGESVLILEDDVFFSEDVAFREMPVGWEIYYGGYAAANVGDLSRSDIEGSHMMGFSKIGAEKVLTYLKNLSCEDIHPPIDAAYVWYRRAHPEAVCFFAVPPLAGQRPSRSDIAALRWFDRTPLVRDFVNWVRRASHNFKKRKSGH
jgi:glycosyl transferase family 25